MGQPGPHPALVRPEMATPSPPEPMTLTPPPTPPENIQSDEDRQKLFEYEQWLTRQEAIFNEHLQYYEKEISKYRKTKKVTKHKGF